MDEEPRSEHGEEPLVRGHAVDEELELTVTEVLAGYEIVSIRGETPAERDKELRQLLDLKEEIARRELTTWIEERAMRYHREVAASFGVEYMPPTPWREDHASDSRMRRHRARIWGPRVRAYFQA